MKVLAIVLPTIALVATAYSDPLRSQIVASDKIICGAIKSKNMALFEKAVRAGAAPNFIYVEKGHTMNMTQMITEVKRGFTTMGSLSTVESKIVGFKESGSTASAMTAHKIVTTVSGPDKKKHTMVYTGTSNETYVKQGGKWLMTKMAWISEGMSMDGKPMKM